MDLKGDGLCQMRRGSPVTSGDLRCNLIGFLLVNNLIMNSSGTRTFWKPLPDSSEGLASQQILKLSGYINFVLKGVHYQSSGNRWQKIFGGSDKITLTSQITYQNGSDTISAAMVQDVRTVDANRATYLGIGRSVALKVPADGDGLEFRTQISAVHDDKFQTILSLLNADEYRKPLELAAPIIGQILTISSLIKKATTTTSTTKLEASYPGIISQEATPNPLETNKLLVGYLILLSSTDADEQNLDQVDSAKLAVTEDGLRYNGKPVKSTYIICSVSVDGVRGLNTKAPWYRKLQDAERKLDDLFTVPESKRQKVYEESIGLWSQGTALLDDDPMYIPQERSNIKKERFLKLTQLHSERVGGKTYFGGSPNQKAGRFIPRGLVGIVDFANENFGDIEASVRHYSSVLERNGMVLNWND